MDKDNKKATERGGAIPPKSFEPLVLHPFLTAEEFVPLHFYKSYKFTKS